MGLMTVRGISLFVKVTGKGDPLLLMHGGPGVDHTTMSPFKALAGQHTLVFYDHRCNGRSDGLPVTSMTFENLTADAEALRLALGFDRWAILGHSFGGMVALEYALRYPQNLSHLILADTCGDTRWVQQKAPEVLAGRGYDEATVELARRFFNGQINPDEMMPAMMKFGSAYYHDINFLQLILQVLAGLRMKQKPEALIFAFGNILKGWSVMDRLGEINVPTLVMAGRYDFQFPPEHQEELAAGIADSRLIIIDNAGHNAPAERTSEVVGVVREFLANKS